MFLPFSHFNLSAEIKLQISNASKNLGSGGN